MIVAATEASQTADALDDILSRWHGWQMQATASRGYRSGGSVTSQYRTPASYLDESDADEAVDAINEGNIMRTVDFQVSQLPALQRYAIGAQARSLYVGSAVFRSPRIPADLWPQVLHEARQNLTRRLKAEGVL